jgi:Spondin_N
MQLNILSRYKKERITMVLRLFVPLFFILTAASPAHAELYKFTFNDAWNEDDISSELPAGAHFTQMVGASHIPGAPLWIPGGTASPGIENVAELGDPTVLSSEVDAAILAGTAGTYLKIRGLFKPPFSRSKLLEIFEDKPAVTLISMVAPSPDWFVGVSDLSLRDESGWIEYLSVDLIPWDAGTEDGNTFTLSNPATNPPSIIAIPPDSPFIGSPVIANLQIEHIAPTGDINENGFVDIGDVVLATRFMLELATPTLEELTRADVMPVDSQGKPAPDGQVTVTDILRLYQLITGL